MLVLVLGMGRSFIPGEVTLYDGQGETSLPDPAERERLSGAIHTGSASRPSLRRLTRTTRCSKEVLGREPGLTVEANIRFQT